MRYKEFRDVMLSKGYSVVDVMDCIRDFLRSDACSSWVLLSFNQHVALFCDHIMDHCERKKRHYDLDDAFNKLMDMYNVEHSWFGDRPLDDVFDDLCYDLWEDFCHLDSHQFDDYWQDLLKDC
jgi:hypothetical protein